jgi:hypothetical protein
MWLTRLTMLCLRIGGYQRCGEHTVTIFRGRSEDEGKMFLRIVGIYLEVRAAKQIIGKI